jgi:hypothetical protein
MCRAIRYPAEHYLVVIWNHGAGWDDTNVYRTARHVLRLNIMRKEEIAERPPGRAKGEVSLRRIRLWGGSHSKPGSA